MSTQQITQQVNTSSLERLEVFKYGLLLRKERLNHTKRERFSQDYEKTSAANSKVREVHKALLEGKATVEEYRAALAAAKAAAKELRAATSAYTRESITLSRLINRINNDLIPAILLSQGFTIHEPNDEDIIVFQALLKHTSKKPKQ